jgi:hypothetical protein
MAVLVCECVYVYGGTVCVSIWSWMMICVAKTLSLDCRIHNSVATKVVVCINVTIFDFACYS